MGVKVRTQNNMLTFKEIDLQYLPDGKLTDDQLLKYKILKVQMETAHKAFRDYVHGLVEGLPPNS